MRILVYGINYAPELTGVGKYTGEMCEWLTNRGHEVRVICASPYYPAWRVADGYSSNQYRREDLNGVRVLRCPLWLPAHQSGLRRILHLLSFAISTFPVVLWTALSWHPQVVFVLEPPFFCTPAALITARLSGAKAWLHVQDLELDAAFALGLLKPRFLKRVAARVERFIMGRFDRVSTISHSMIANIRSKGVSRRAALFFPNWVDSDSIYPIPGESELRKEWGVDLDSVVVLYSGNMGEKQGLEIVVEAARNLSDEKQILFVLSGDGAARKRLELSAVGLDNIRFTPLQPADRLNDLLNMADIHILPQRPDVASLVMPSKLLGILASGRPVVATAEKSSELAHVLIRSGIVVSPGDTQALSEAIRRLAGDAMQRSQLGAAARALCLERWDIRNVLENFEKSLTEICQESSDA